jgi:thiamine biosynthesis protein ThiS
MTGTITINVNGEQRSIGGGLSVAGLLADLGLDRRKVAVERNLEIVPKSRFDATLLTDGDRLEIVHFIGGG